ncbi:CBS domain-containing protein [Hydrogenophaga sp. XSHU_21]
MMEPDTAAVGAAVSVVQDVLKEAKMQTQMLKDVMTRDVLVIGPDATVKEAAARMRDEGFGMMPVGENDRMIGVVSDRDIAMRAVAEGKPCDTPVRDVMSEGVIWAFDDDSVEEGARKMSEFQVRRLPVVDHDKRLVGIVSLGDVAVEALDNQTAGHALTDISRP